MMKEQRQMENNWKGHAEKMAPMYRHLAVQTSAGSVYLIIPVQLCFGPRYPKALVGGKEQL